MATGIAALGLLGGYLQGQGDAPGFIIFQPNEQGLVTALFQSATGSPIPIYSLYTGLTTILDNISGASNDFRFSNGRMFVGKQNSIYGSGALNINWINSGAFNGRAGIVINKTGADFDAGPDPYLVSRNYYLAGNVYSECKEFVGGGISPLNRDPLEYGVPGYSSLANTYSSPSFTPGSMIGSETAAKWCGWKFLTQDSGPTIYRKFGIYQSYIDVGTTEEDGSVISNGGTGFLALRQAAASPTSMVPTVASLYYAKDSNLKLFTSREISLAPNLSGISQFAYDSSVFTGVSFSAGRYVLTNAHNGKKVRITEATAGTIIVTGTVSNGFSCECHVRGAGTISFSGSSPLTRRSRGNLYTGAGQYAVVNLVRDSNDLIIYGDLV